MSLENAVILFFFSFFRTESQCSHSFSLSRAFGAYVTSPTVGSNVCSVRCFLVHGNLLLERSSIFWKTAIILHACKTSFSSNLCPKGEKKTQILSIVWCHSCVHQVHQNVTEIITTNDVRISITYVNYFKSV